MSRSCSTGSGSWLDHLPFVLLGMRTAVRDDSDCSPADLLYGAPLCLPGDMFSPSDPQPMPSDFARRLRVVLGAAAPIPIVHNRAPVSRVDPALRSASHVFLRVDAVRRPLVPPYLGPFQVLGHSEDFKTFRILQNGRTEVVTVDRLKPAHVLPVRASVPATPPSVGSFPSSSPPATSAPSSPSPSSVPLSPSPAASLDTAPRRLDPDVWPLPTRAGRRPRPPVRLNL